MKLVRDIIIALASGLVVACGDGNVRSDVITANDVFTVTTDSVAEGSFIAYAPSSTEIVSNYPSAIDDAPMSPLPFRLAFNMRDNELPAGNFHVAHIKGDTIYAIAGVPDTIPATPTDTIEPNTRCTLRVDLTAMTKAFREKGVWVTATGDSIYSDEFGGVWVIGNVAPLSWSTKTLISNNKSKLRPTREEGIYQLDLVLNPDTYRRDTQFSHWSIDAPNEQFPQFSTSINLVDATYNMAIDAIANAQFDEIGCSKISLATYLALAHLMPSQCAKLLRSKVKNRIITQEASSRLASPIINDRLIWAAAAWQVYCANGDKNWLKYAYNVISTTIEHDRDFIFCDDFWLIHGNDCFTSIDDVYPRWMQAKDYYESIRLSANVIYAHCHYILSEMATELDNDESETHFEEYKRIKENINQRLWNERQGSYCAYLINESYPAQSGMVCNFSQALCMLLDIADDDRAITLLKRTPFVAEGIPNTYPLNAAETDAQRLPYIQSLWNIAAARNGNQEMLRLGLASQLRSAAFFGYTTSRFSKADNLLNACADVAVMLSGIAGITVTPEGIEFNPVVPEFMTADKTVTALRYRNAMLDVVIHGMGSNIEAILLDGEPMTSNFISNDISGKHTVEITMSRSKADDNQQVNLTEMRQRPFTPSVIWSGDSVRISNFQNENTYAVAINDRVFTGVQSAFVMPQLEQAFNIVYVVAKHDDCQSFISKPHFIYSAKDCQRIDISRYAQTGTDILDGHLGSKAVEFSASRNSIITFPVEVDQAGEYYLDLLYANGATAIGNCPSAQLVVNTHKQDIIVMPQRGYGEWRNTGYTNMVSIQLLKGRNVIQLQFTSANAVGSSAARASSSAATASSASLGSSTSKHYARSTTTERAILHHARLFKK